MVDTADMHERLQKILSARGVCSRRKAEEYIERGLVTVNGVPATIGQKADLAVDVVEVDGVVLQERQELLYYLMAKPRGVVTTNIGGVRGDRKSRGDRGMLRDSSVSSGSSDSSVRDLLPHDLQGKIFPVGRLDKDTSGLLLFTNDGALAYRLTHPKFHHEKEYVVKVVSPIADGALKKLAEGLKILGAKTKPAVIHRISPRSFRIAITEGKNRQIRRMCQKIGSPVERLKRIRIVTLMDDTLKDGEIRKLTVKEKDALLKAVGLV